MNKWLYELILLLAAAATFISLLRHLPLQNVLLASGIIGVISWVMEMVKTRLLVGGVESQILWTVPILWIVLIINSRGVARLILRRWRQDRFYGFGVIGVALLLAVIFDLALEWQFAHRLIDWKTTVISGVTALLSLFLATPTLLSKGARPMTKSE